MRGLRPRVLAAAILAACNDAPAPTRIDDPRTLLEVARPPKSEGPFVNPNRDPPPPRGGAQQGGDELAATLAAAQQLRDDGKPTDALVALQHCLNREPRSGACEARYAAIALEQRVQKSWARHFADEAVLADDPAASDDLYRELGRLTAANGRQSTSARAYELVIARGVATAEDYAGLAHALQADPQRTMQAIEALERAYELDPTRHEWLRDRATLLAQSGDAAAALPLFERYRGTLGGDARLRAQIDERIASLQQQLTPTVDSSPL